MTDGRDEVIENTELVIRMLSDRTSLENEKAQLEEELTVVAQMVQDCIAENARIAQNQEKYMEKYSSLTSRYETAKEKLDKVTGEIASRTARARELRRFADRLKESGTVTEFDEVLWSDFVDYVTVDSKKRMTFTFRDGTDITV